MPVAFFYKVFGVTPLTSTLWPFLCSILTIIAVFVSAKKIFGNKAAVFATVLISFNTLQLKHTLWLSSDIIVSLFIFISILLLFYGRRTNCRKYKIFFAVATAVFITVAFITKLSMVPVVLFCIIMCLYDFFHKKNLIFWVFLLITGFSLAGFYFGTYKLVTGYFLLRFIGIQLCHNVGFLPLVYPELTGLFYFADSSSKCNS